MKKFRIVPIQILQTGLQMIGKNGVVRSICEVMLLTVQFAGCIFHVAVLWPFSLYCTNFIRSAVFMAYDYNVCACVCVCVRACVRACV